MDKHVTLVAALNIGFGALGVFLAIVVFVSIVVGGLISGDSDAIAITSIVGPAIALLILIFSLPSVIAGVGLLKRKPWSRVLSLIVAVIDLLNIPIGTAIGVYALWVLMQEETIHLLSGESAAS